MIREDNGSLEGNRTVYTDIFCGRADNDRFDIDLSPVSYHEICWCIINQELYCYTTKLVFDCTIQPLLVTSGNYMVASCTSLNSPHLTSLVRNYQRSDPGLDRFARCGPCFNVCCAIFKEEALQHSHATSKSESDK